ncbi:olfactory receptor 5M8-like [Choloepus didactylus]|uniref:olfactory receptor 5M8-like n=1 Tax=Choloepus didactylus TaxID=27675 RepID=UPI00189F3628|nr:olfactory receptor 5M8-like [Choloepus didactylus]
MRRNFTIVTEFILLGLTNCLELQILFFVLFLAVYMVTVAGNLSMIILIEVNDQLHTPMYFFLSHLSFVDLCFSTNVTPKMLETFLSDKKTISYPSCLVQCYLFIALVHVEVYILAVMAFDWYMAICNPLLYGRKMSKSVYTSLIVVPYVYGALTGLMETMWTYNLIFCGPNEINHFYCADPPLIKLACSDTYNKEISMFVVAGCNLSVSLLIILISYFYIFPAILRIHSSEGRLKAFSTCGSHLTAVTIFYTTLFFMYLRLPSKESVEQGKMVAIFYTTAIPMLNPMIYSLRNKDVKNALTRELFRKKYFIKKVSLLCVQNLFLDLFFNTDDGLHGEMRNMIHQGELKRVFTFNFNYFKNSKHIKQNFCYDSLCVVVMIWVVHQIFLYP